MNNGQMPSWMDYFLGATKDPDTLTGHRISNEAKMATLAACAAATQPLGLTAVSALAKGSPIASIWLDMMSEGMPTYAESYPEKAALRQDQIDTTLPLRPSAYVTGRPKVLSQMPAPSITGQQTQFQGNPNTINERYAGRYDDRIQRLAGGPLGAALKY
jgi:hypothetical protein